jgi:hypothetical protein
MGILNDIVNKLRGKSWAGAPILQSVDIEVVLVQLAENGGKVPDSPRG